MQSADICPHCGTPFPGGTWGGRCPRCLLGLGFAAPPAPPPATERPAGSTPDAAGGLGLGGGPEASAPRRLGDYELLEEISRGGMGVVYRARQLSLQRVVAVKLLLVGRFASPESIHRFEREARAAARLHHPNIVAIHEYGLVEGQPYLSMDLVEGSHLGRLVRDQPLSPQHAARYVRDIARAVEYAHSQGILHRDLKPSNILIDAEDQPRLTDFGLAKVLGEGLDVTLTGQALGSPNYMAPEQAAGRHEIVGPAADLYSLGAILYHLLTGRPPFLAATLTGTLRQVLESEPVAPRQLNPHLPRDLETLCLKCLDKQPERRLATAGALAEELDRFLKGEPIRSRPIGAAERSLRWCRRNPRLAALTVCVSALALVIVAGGPLAAIRIRHERNAALRFGQEAVRQERATREALHRLEIQRARELISADDAAGGLAVLAALLRRDPADQLAARWLVTESTHRSFALPSQDPFIHADSVHHAEVSLDGRRLLTVTRQNLARLWDLTTGNVVGEPLAHDPDFVRPGEYLKGLHPIIATFSPDGRLVATASLDGTARVWESENGKPLTAPLAHPAGVTCATFSADGHTLVTGTQDGLIRLWDTRSGEPLRVTMRHNQWVNSLEISPNQTLLLSGADDATARLWHLPGGEPTGLVLHHARAVRHATFSPDGRRVATGSSDFTARIWDTESGEPTVPPLHHQWLIHRVAFSPDGIRLATAAADQAARLWDSSTGQPIGPPLAHRGAVRGLAFSPDASRLVTASEDGTARVWDARSGSPVTEPFRHQGAVWSALFTPDGTKVVTASSDRMAVVWDVRPGAARGTQIPRYKKVYSASWSRDAKWILSTSRANALISDARTGVPLNHRAMHLHAELTDAVFSPDSERVAVADAAGMAQIWETRTSDLLACLAGHREAIHSVRFGPDGARLVTASADQTVRLWEVATGMAWCPPMTHPGAVFHAEFNPSGTLVATACADHQVRLFDGQTGRLATGPLPHDDEVTLVRFSPDGRHLLGVSRAGSASVWDVPSGRQVGETIRHGPSITAAAFSPDGSRVITAGSDRCARLWASLTGRPAGPPLVHEAKVNAADFSPDGHWVSTGTEDGQALVWETTRSRPVGGPFRHDRAVTVVAFHPNGRQLLTASADWHVRVWDLPPVPTPVPDWLPPFVESVIGQRRNADGVVESVSIAELSRRIRQVRESPPTGSLGEWSHWFVADRLTRLVSPGADLTVREWIDQGTFEAAQSDSDSPLDLLRLALPYAPADPYLMSAMGRLVSRQDTQQNPRALREAEWLIQRSLSLGPGEANVWRARATFLRQCGRPDEAVSALQTGLQCSPRHYYLWQELPLALAETGHSAEANAAFEQAVQVTEESSELDSKGMAAARLRLQWAQFLDRQRPLGEDRSGALRALRIPPRALGLPEHLIDLSAFYNGGLRQPWLPLGRFDDLSALPTGHQEIAGIPFDLRGVIQLAALPAGMDDTQFPERLNGIPLRQRCRRLHFLHATAEPAAFGSKIGAYLIHQEGLGTTEVPLVYGREMVAWGLPPQTTQGLDGAPGPTPVWSGPGKAHPVVHLFLLSWTVPEPDRTIESLDFLSYLRGSAPFLVAITAEPPESPSR